MRIQTVETFFIKNTPRETFSIISIIGTIIKILQEKKSKGLDFWETT